MYTSSYLSRPSNNIGDCCYKDNTIRLFSGEIYKKMNDCIERLSLMTAIGDLL